MSKKDLEPWVTHAYKIAKKARTRAYAPYSHFKVGAALVTTDNKIFPGCNVENASFGGTVCAERNAIFNMVSSIGVHQLKGLVLITDPIAVPCGLCLQVLSEFASSNFPIYAFDTNGKHTLNLLKDLLPNRFDPESLPKKPRK